MSGPCFQNYNPLPHCARHTRWGVIIGLLLSIAGGTALHAETDLVARWTFSKGDASDLIDDVGKIKLTRDTKVSAQDGVMDHHKDGTVALGSGCRLMAPQVNSQTFPSLTRAVTLWVRWKVAPPGPGTAFLLGLTTGAPPRKSGDQIFDLVYTHVESRDGLGLYAQLTDGPFGNATQDITPDPSGYQVCAITYSMATGEGTAVVGNEILKRKRGGAGELLPFDDLSVGRLNITLGAALQIDEIRIYSRALGLKEIQAIKPSGLSPQ